MTGKLFGPVPPHPEFFRSSYSIFYQGRHFGEYSPFHPFVLVAGIFLGSPYVISPLSAGLFLIILYAIGKELLGSRGARWACLLVLFSPYFIFMNGTLLSHSTSLLLTAIFLLALVKLDANQSRWWACLAGLVAGLLFLTRVYTSMALGCVLGLGYFITSLCYCPWRTVAKQCLLFIVFCVPVVVLHLFYNKILTGQYLLFPYHLTLPAFHKLGFGTRSTGLYTPLIGAINMFYNLGLLNLWLWGWPFSFLFVVILLFCRKKRWDWLLVSSCLALPLAYFFYHYRGVFEIGPVYYYELILPLSLLTVRGIQELRKQFPGNIVTRNISVVVFASYMLAVPFWLEQTAIMWEATRYRNDIFQTLKAEKIHHALVFIPDRTTDMILSPNRLVMKNVNYTEDILFAADRGEANHLLIDVFPNRTPYRYIFDEQLKKGRVFLYSETRRPNNLRGYSL